MNGAKRNYVTKRILRDRNEYDSPIVKARRRASSVDSDSRTKPLTMYMPPVRRVRDITLLKKKAVERKEDNAQTEAEASADTFSEHGIPPELIAHIIYFLPRKSLVNFALTSRRMKTLAYRCPNLWDDVVLQTKPQTESAIHSIIARGVRSLFISDCLIKQNLHLLENDHRTSLNVNGSISNLTQLEISALAGRPAPSDVAARIISRTKSLMNLSIERMPLTTGLADAISKNRNLVKLNMCTCTNVSLIHCETIFESCSRLIELNISWTDIAPDKFDQIVQILPKSLQRLSLSNQAFKYWTSKTSDLLLKRCQNLVELDMSDIFQRGTESLFTLINGLKKLQVLHISRLFYIDKTALLELPKNITYLTAFHIMTGGIKKQLLRQNRKITINESPLINIARFTISSPVFKKPKAERKEDEESDLRFFYEIPIRRYNI